MRTSRHPTLTVRRRRPTWPVRHVLRLLASGLKPAQVAAQTGKTLAAVSAVNCRYREELQAGSLSTKNVTISLA